jgi:hypothetical protein
VGTDGKRKTAWHHTAARSPSPAVSRGPSLALSISISLSRTHLSMYLSRPLSLSLSLSLSAGRQSAQTTRGGLESGSMYVSVHAPDNRGLILGIGGGARGRAGRGIGGTIAQPHIDLVHGYSAVLYYHPALTCGGAAFPIVWTQEASLQNYRFETHSRRLRGAGDIPSSEGHPRSRIQPLLVQSV